MLIIGYLGSPRPNGTTGKLLQSALDGAAAAGADVKRYDLVNCNIRFCKGCGTCFSAKPGLPIGPCPLGDDMAAMLAEYLHADGYFYASPCYDLYITAIMKMFLERKIALTYKPEDQPGKFPEPRPGAAVGFRKKASMIVSANSVDDFAEVMGGPCFEAMGGSLIWEQIDTLDTLYVGGVESLTEEILADRLKRAYRMGAHLVEVLQQTQGHGY